MHVLHVAGDEGGRALVVNGVLVDVCPADGAGTHIQDVAAFFANLGQAVGSPFAVVEHIADVERLDCLLTSGPGPRWLHASGSKPRPTGRYPKAGREQLWRPSPPGSSPGTATTFYRRSTTW